jgi:C-methyltransferase
MTTTYLNQRFAFYNDFIGRTRDTMAFVALSELGVFTQLCSGEATLEQIATCTGAGTARLKKYLDLMLTCGILQRTEDTYSLIPGDEQIFSAESPFSHSIPKKVESFFSLYTKGTDILRSDQHQEHAGPGGDVDEKQRRGFLTFLDGRSRAVAEEVARILATDDVSTILDLGCGAGTYSWALLDAVPSAQAVLFDRENAKDLVQEFCANRTHTERSEFRGGDFFTDDLGGPYNLAILSNLIHCFDYDSSVQILSRVRESLSSDGRIAIKDITVSEDRSGPHNALRFGVTMAMLTEGGDVYSPTDISAMAKEAGLRVRMIHPLDKAPESLLYILRK